MSLLGAWVYNILYILFMFIFILLIAKFFLGWNIIKFRKKDYIIFSCAVLARGSYLMPQSEEDSLQTHFSL